MSISQDKPCSHGHISPRRKNGNCIECEQLRSKTPEKLEAARLQQAARRARINSDPALKAKQQEYMKEYGKKNRDKLNGQGLELYHRNKVKIRLQRKGIVVTEEILDYIQNHSGLCDLCEQPPNGKWKELAYDHCHISGVLRGLLCDSCNRGLGFFKDNTDVLNRAVAYLTHYKSG